MFRIKNKGILTKETFNKISTDNNITPVYLGYFLTEHDSNQLVRIAQQYIDTNVVYGTPVADHITALFAPNNSILITKLLELSDSVSVFISEIYYTQRLAAFKVEISPEFMFDDRTPHITTLLMPKVSPVESNALFPGKEQDPEVFYKNNPQIKKVVIPKQEIILHTGLFANIKPKKTTSNSFKQTGGQYIYINYTLKKCT